MLWRVHSGNLCNKTKFHGSLCALAVLERSECLSEIYLLFNGEGLLACGVLERRLILETSLLSCRSAVWWVEFAPSTWNLLVLILAYLLFYLWTLKLAKSQLFLWSFCVTCLMDIMLLPVLMLWVFMTMNVCMEFCSLGMWNLLYYSTVKHHCHVPNPYR